MRVIKNYLWNVFYQLFIIIVPIVTMPYVSRILGPRGIGINSYTNSIAQYFVLFGSIGVGLYGNRQIAYVRDDQDELTQTFWEIVFMRFLTIICSLIIFFIFLPFFNKYKYYLVLQIVLIVAAAFDISWFFMGVENFKVTVVRSTLIRVVSLIMIFTLVKKSTDIDIYILIIAISTLLGNITLFPYLKKYIGRPKIDKLNIFRHLRPSLGLFIPQIAVQIYVILNKTMLGQLDSAESAGFYDSSDKIIRMLLAIVTSIGTVMLPYAANKFIQKDIEAINKVLYISFDFVSFVSVPLMFGLAGVSGKFTLLFFGHGFSMVGTLMIIESVASLFIAWDNTIGTQFLLPTHQNRAYTISVSLGAVVNILINVPLIIFLKAPGSMIATVLSELTVTAYMLWAIRKQIKIQQLFKNLHKYFIAGFTMYIVLRLVDTRLSADWISLAFETIIGLITYALLIVITRPTVFNNIKSIFIEKNN